MIDLGHVKGILAEAEALVAELHGVELNEERAVEDQTKNRTRIERARLSQDLNLLAGRLDLAAELVRNEYWFARGEDDPLNPERES